MKLCSKLFQIQVIFSISLVSMELIKEPPLLVDEERSGEDEEQMESVDVADLKKEMPHWGQEEIEEKYHDLLERAFLLKTHSSCEQRHDSAVLIRHHSLSLEERVSNCLMTSLINKRMFSLIRQKSTLDALLDKTTSLAELSAAHRSYLLLYIKALILYGAKLAPERYFLWLLTHRPDLHLYEKLSSLFPLALQFHLHPLIKITFPFVKDPDLVVDAFLPKTQEELAMKYLMYIHSKREGYLHLSQGRTVKNELQQFVNWFYPEVSPIAITEVKKARLKGIATLPSIETILSPRRRVSVPSKEPAISPKGAPGGHSPDGEKEKAPKRVDRKQRVQEQKGHMRTASGSIVSPKASLVSRGSEGAIPPLPLDTLPAVAPSPRPSTPKNRSSRRRSADLVTPRGESRRVIDVDALLKTDYFSALPESVRLYIALYSSNLKEFQRKLSTFFHADRQAKVPKSAQEKHYAFEFDRKFAESREVALTIDTLVQSELFDGFPEEIRLDLALKYCKDDVDSFVKLLKEGKLMQLSDKDLQFIDACQSADYNIAFLVLELVTVRDMPQYMMSLQRFRQQSVRPYLPAATLTDFHFVNRILVDIGLWIALKMGHKEFVLQLLKALKPIPEGQEMDMVNSYEWSHARALIQAAVESGDKAIVAAVFSRNRHVGRKSYTTLEQAITMDLVFTENPEVQELLIGYIMDNELQQITGAVPVAKIPRRILQNYLTSKAPDLKTTVLSIFSKLDLSSLTDIQKKFVFHQFCSNGRIDALKGYFTGNVALPEIERHILIARALASGKHNVAYYLACQPARTELEMVKRHLKLDR